MAIFRITNKNKIEVNNKHTYIGPANEVVFLQEPEDVQYLRGLSVNLIVCNFMKTDEIHKQILPSISDGYYRTGVIKYLK